MDAIGKMKDAMDKILHPGDDQNNKGKSFVIATTSLATLRYTGAGSSLGIPLA